MKLSQKTNETLYVIFRVIIGILFLMHGWTKVPGVMNGSIPLVSLMALAGLIEIVGGLFFIIGLWVRPTAMITAIEMVVAFFKVHVPQGLNPLTNQGEPAVLFFVAFLVLVVYGAGKWAIDKR